MFKPLPTDKPQTDPHALDRYTDPTGEFTNRDLRFSEWLIKHKILLLQIFTGFLIVVCVIFGSFSLYKIIEYTFYGYRLDEAQRANLTRLGVSVKNSKTEVAATPLNIEPVQVFPSSPGKTDFLAFADNVNDRWVAHVYYNFVIGETETEVKDAWLWPKWRQALVLSGVEGEAPAGARLNVKKVDWYRLDNHTYPDPAGFVADRLTFGAEDVVFSPANPSLGLSVSQTKFNLKNETAFGYWQVPFTAVLRKGDVVVGVKQFVVDNFAPESSNSIELHSLVETLDLDAVEVYPNLNLFDSTLYLPFKK